MAKLGQFGTRALSVEIVTVTGGVQSDAAAIPTKSSPALVVAAGDGVAGIRLPKASKGMIFFVKNTGTTGFLGILKVYPATGHQINTLGANIAMQMATLTSAVFIAANSTTWYTFSFLPS